MASATLTLDQYLTPIRELKSIVQYPNLTAPIGLSTLESLLLSHVPYLRNPTAPRGSPSAESRAQLDKGKAKVQAVDNQGKTIDLEMTLSDSSKAFALEVSERLGIDEVESAMLCRRFRNEESGLLADLAAKEASTTLQTSVLSKSRKVKPTKTQTADTLALITRYYFNEVVDICELLTAIIRTASARGPAEIIDDLLLVTNDAEATMDADTRSAKIKAIAQKVLDQVVGKSPADFVQGLFMDFAKAAQTPATMKYGKDVAKQWALHYLGKQKAILEALFIYVFWDTTTVLKADLSVGLIQGALGSAFGAHQLNQRLIDMLPPSDCDFYLDKIQSLLGLICLEASGLTALQSGAIQPGDLALDHIEIMDPAERHLVQSRDHIIQLHQSLGGSSPDCTSREPFPLLLLGWASVLSQLPDHLQPEDQSLQEVPTFQRVATAALSPEMNIFERWSRMQAGAILRKAEYGAEDEMDSMNYKETLQALLMALSTLVRASYIKDLDGLLEVWATLFGNGSSASAANLCNLFWENAADHSSTGEILEVVNFPLYPLQSFKLLQSLSGMGSQEIPNEDGDLSEAKQAANYSFQWLAQIRYLTLVLPEAEDVDDNFRRVQEDNGSYARFNVKDIELPGGLTIPSGSRGVELNRVNDKPVIIKWATHINGWNIVLSLLREAAGLNPPSRHKWEDFGISVPADQVLSSGISLISRLIAANDELGRDLLDLKGNSKSDILDIVFSVIRNRQIASSQEPIHVSLMSSALNMITCFVKTRSGRLWIEIQQAGMFSTTSQGNKTTVAQQIIEKEAKAGDYPSTLCVLRLVLALTENTVDEQFERDYRHIHAQSEFLAAIVRFVHQSIWTRYTAWRYVHLTHRAEIGSLLCEIYDKIATGPTFTITTTPEGTVHPLIAISSAVLDMLVQNSSPFDFEPLFQILTQPKRLLDSLRRHGRRAEEMATEKTLLRGLHLATSLVRTSSQIYRSGGGLPTILTMMFDPAVAAPDVKEHYHLVNILFDYIFSPKFQVDTAIASAGLLQQLAAIQSAEDGSLSILPCLQEPRRIGKELQATLQDKSRTAALHRCLWHLLMTASQYQTGFASLCLDPRSIFIFGPAAVEADETANSQTILRDVTDIVANWGTYWDADTAPLLSTMRILEVVYVYHPQIAVVGGCGARAELWEALYGIVTSSQANAPLISTQMLDDDEDRKALIADVVRYSSRRRIRASAVRILAAVLERADPAILEEKSAPQKTALRLFAEPEAYRMMIAEAGQNACQPLAMSDSLSAIQKRLQHCDIQSLTNPVNEDASNFGEHYGFDLESITSVISDPELKISVARQLSSINLYWSEMRADNSFSSAVNAYTYNAVAIAATPNVAVSSAKAVQAIMLEASREDRAGDFMLGVQMERYQIIETLLQTVWLGEWTGETAWLLECVEALSVLGDHPIFSPMLIAQSSNVYLQTTILDSCVYLLSIAHVGTSWEDDRTLARVRPALRRIGTFVTEILSDAMVTLSTGNSSGLLENMEKINAVYGMFAADPRLFEILAHILDEHGIIKRSCEILSQLDLAGDYAMQHTNICRILLELHRVIAQDTSGAGRLSAAEAIQTYSATSLTEISSSQGVGVPDITELDELWANMLSNIALILRRLPYITTVVTEEVIPFINRVSSRVRNATEWELRGEFSLEGLREVIALLEIIRYIVIVIADDAEMKMSLLQDYAAPLLRLMRAVTNALNKPTLIRTYFEQSADNENQLSTKVLAALVDSAASSVMRALMTAADTIVMILRDLTYAIQVLLRSPDANLLAPNCVLPSLSLDVSAVKILLDLDSALQDLELPPSQSHALGRGARRLIDLPLLPENSVKDDVARTREYGLILTVVQAVTRHERDVAEEQMEKMEAERKKADNSTDSLPALAEEKKIKAGRRRARQDLRDVHERIRRTISSERSQVAQICGDFLQERCGADLSTW
ncbi:hypothetical protein NliqN6_4246 [Naganishia liquefaciens]|uniref:Nucleoporin Nup188 N-terminal subdomain III domain-containing protein n=1 Tax=Naganishia liquefaciens TaxID=104408 RepID=A0A8H3TX72_9TREE|nr:hypothetical protein NliqN6_4246 [Naganishia liquefaciens]